METLHANEHYISFADIDLSQKSAYEDEQTSFTFFSEQIEAFINRSRKNSLDTSCCPCAQVQVPSFNDLTLQNVDCPTSDSLNTGEYDSIEREFFMRCVVLGASGAKKHQLINNNSGQASSNNTESDLIMRNIINGNTTKKYHFWVRTLGESSEVQEAVWTTYYKWAMTFIFVYDTTDRSSFEMLEQAVRRVQQVVPKDNFFGVLVGLRNDTSKDKEVTTDEAKRFQSQHKMNHFIETSSIERGAPAVLSKLDTKLKLVFEAI